MIRVHLRLFVAILALISASLLAGSLTIAQRNAVDTYAITNARVVLVSAPTLERGTVVIRDGLIEAVGANVTPPADARIIDGTGLTVYPGLIDAYTNLGIPEPPPAPSPSPGAGFQQASARPPLAAGAPNSTRPPGLQPETLAEDLLRGSGDQYESVRNTGITTVLSTPRGGIWIGQSALINLAGDSIQQMIVRSPIAMHVGFNPLRGTYPGSLMGVFASLRQMLLDAHTYREARQIYDRNPRGIRRPSPDRSLEALLPVLDGRMPVVFSVDRERDIRRALDLAEEFKLKAIIAGGSEAWKVSDRLQKNDVPVLLSLNLPRRTTAAMPQADPEPLRVLRDRVEAPKTAAKLALAKVRFAFQSGGMTNINDFLPNAGKTIEGGLLKDDAVRALTIRPAEIFGVSDRLGSVEVGKIANLTVMRGDLFDRTSRVAHLFIDGRPIDLRSGTRPGGAGQPSTESAAVLSGTWNITITLTDQNLPGTLILNQQGNSISGSLQTSLAGTEFSGGRVEGSTFTVNMTATVEGEQMAFTMVGTVAGNEINGTLNGPMGAAPFRGTKPQ
jgi:imidazolonepropionase-like amidohydrolase